MNILKEMYPGIPFSPPTQLAATISASETEIYVEDSGCLPDAPNYATLGVDENAEVIFYTGKELGVLKGCTRAIEGNARSWPMGTEVARHFTESDYAALTANMRIVAAVAEKNRSDVNERIKKFFTNNLGETHVTDSDDGYMRNGVLSGKSLQDAEPTPDAPQEIKSVENVGVKVTGAQLFNMHDDIAANGTASCEVNGDIVTVLATKTDANPVYSWVRWDYDISHFAGISNLTVSVRKMTAIGGTIPSIFVRTLDSNGANLGQAQIGASGESKTVSLEGVKIVRVIVYATGGTAITKGEGATYEGIMLNAGTEPLPWQPYTEQSITVPHVLCGLPVSEGGNYTNKDGQQWICDEVDFERGVLVQRVATEVFDGSSDEKWIRDATKTEGMYRWGTYAVDSKILPVPDANTQGALLSSHYLAKTAGNTFALTQGVGITSNGKLYIYDDEFVSSELANWQAHLEENPLTLQYALLTPVEIPLSAEEIEAYKALLTHYGGTNIFFESANGVEPNLNFDYPCAMDAFVEYIKEQMGDTRTFVYNMDSRLSDEEYLSALAYVNSEYAAALLELEV